MRILGPIMEELTPAVMGIMLDLGGRCDHWGELIFASHFVFGAVAACVHCIKPASRQPGFSYPVFFAGRLGHRTPAAICGID